MKRPNIKYFTSLFPMVSVEATARKEQQGSEGHGYKDEVNPLLSTAEQCLTAMKTRIKITHGVSKMFAGILSDKLIINNAYAC